MEVITLSCHRALLTFILYQNEMSALIRKILKYFFKTYWTILKTEALFENEADLTTIKQ